MFTQNKYKDIPVKTKAIFLFHYREIKYCSYKILCHVRYMDDTHSQGVTEIYFSNEEHNHQDTFQHC